MACGTKHLDKAPRCEAALDITWYRNTLPRNPKHSFSCYAFMFYSLSPFSMSENHFLFQSFAFHPSYASVLFSVAISHVKVAFNNKRFIISNNNWDAVWVMMSHPSSFKAPSPSRCTNWISHRQCFQQNFRAPLSLRVTGRPYLSPFKFASTSPLLITSMYNAIADRELGLTTGTLTLSKQYDSEVFHRIPGDLLSRILEVMLR